MTQTTESPTLVPFQGFPQAPGSGGFYTAEPHAGRPPISLIDDGKGCTMPADIGRDQCAACWRPSRTGPRITPAAMVTLHSGGELECVDRVHVATVALTQGVDKPQGLGGVEDTTPLNEGVRA